MKIKHPAWRLALALKARGVPLEQAGLPEAAGWGEWNKTSEMIAHILEYKDDKATMDAILYNQKNGEEYSDIYDTLRLFDLDEYRINIETYLLAGGGDEWLTESFSLRKCTIEAYRRCCFDVSVFQNSLDKIEYIDSIIDDDERASKKEWVKGVEYIKWRMGFKADVDISSDVLKMLYGAIERQNDSDPELAVKWGHVAAKLVSEIQKKGGDKKADSLSLNDLGLALSLEDPEFSTLVNRREEDAMGADETGD